MSAHHNYRVRLQDRLDGFIRIADQMNVDIGLYRLVRGQGPEAAFGEWQGNVWLIERKRIGNDFEHQQTDSRRQAGRKLRRCFEGFERLGDRRVEDDNLHGGLLGYDRSR